MSFNISTTVRPRLHHLGLTTADASAMAEWYGHVLGMTVVHATQSAAPDQADMSPVSITWLTNDEANHRMALVELKTLTPDHARADHPRVQHFAFEYQRLDELLGSYLRLRDLGIRPVLCTDAGLQTAFYYEDPDGKSVELNVDNFGNPSTSSEYVRNSPEFARNPLGVFVDPEKMIAAHSAGASPWELHVRARSGEFLPEQQYDPRVMI